jgi:hypothetical protein
MKCIVPKADFALMDAQRECSTRLDCGYILVLLLATLWIILKSDAISPAPKIFPV